MRPLRRFAGFLLLAVLGATLSGAEPLDRVTLQLKWRHQFQFAGYYAALEQGYYREAGLDVVLREAEPGHDPVETVLNGQAEFGVGTSDLMLLRSRSCSAAASPCKAPPPAGRSSRSRSRPRFLRKPPDREG